LNHIELKIQTNSSTVAPIEVLSAAIEDLSNETDHLISQVSDAIEDWRKENEAAGGVSQF
jgi:DNA-directed RNA polymerase II subunit RPB11